MTWIAFAVSIGAVVLIALILAVMPSVTQRTVPLGVSVPSARVNEPIVRTSIRRYRRGVAVAFAISVVAAVVLLWSAPVAATSVPMLMMLVLGGAAYVIARRGIRQAKNDGGWYDDVPVRLSANVTPATAPRASIATGWYLVSLMLLAAAAVVGVAAYPRLPNPVPIHWDAAGHVDGYADKSVWSVFGPLLVGVGVVVLLFLIALWVRATPPRIRAGGDPRLQAARARRQLHLMQGLLGQLTLIVTLTMGVLAVLGWLAPGNAAAMGCAGIGLVVLFVIAMVVYLMRYQRATAVVSSAPSTTDAPHDTATKTRLARRRPAGADALGADVLGADALGADALGADVVGAEGPGADAVGAGGPGADAPDDDRFWKLGFVYVNRNDPAIMVPKRFGIGWTINLGSPAGMATGILIGAILIAAIVVGIVVPTHHLG